MLKKQYLHTHCVTKSSATTKNMQHMKDITDSVHGRIYLPENVLRLTHNKIWRRTRYIAQLSFVSELYHCASHTRAQHMMGAAHLAFVASSRLQRKYPSRVTYNHVLTVTVAALLHDIGHGPFSHEFEATCSSLGLEFDHECMTLQLIHLLQDMEPEACSLLSADEWVAVCDCITGNKKGVALPWQVDLISGKVDVDKMDYLSRDFLNIGAAASFNTNTVMFIIEHMTLSATSDTLGFDVSVLNAISKLYQSRKELHEGICMHHTTLGMKLMLKTAALGSASLQAKICQAIKDPLEFIKLTDTFLLDFVNTTTEFSYGVQVAKCIEFSRTIPICLGIISSSTTKLLPPRITAAIPEWCELSQVCIGFGKSVDNVLLQIPFVNRDGEPVATEALLAQTILPKKCIVFKSYVFVRPLQTVPHSDLRKFQETLKTMCDLFKDVVWTRRPLSGESSGRVTLE